MRSWCPLPPVTPPHVCTSPVLAWTATRLLRFFVVQMQDVGCCEHLSTRTLGVACLSSATFLIFFFFKKSFVILF